MRPISEIQVYLVYARIVLAEYWYSILLKSSSGENITEYEWHRVRIVKALIKTIQYNIDYVPTQQQLINEQFNTLLDYLPANFLSTTYEVHNPQMTQLVNQIFIGFVAKATDLTYGIVRLSAPALDPDDPIVIAENDARVAQWTEASNKTIESAELIEKGEFYVIDLVRKDSSVVTIEFPQSYRHIQMTNSTTWVITHDLGFRPSVTVIDLDGDVVNGDIAYNTNNQLTITFSSAIKGEAYLN
jgi:hypothetical protein